MAFGRLERPQANKPMSDINMTPLIDVMLVLLVIFMITAPLMASSLKLDLPKASGASASDSPQFMSIGLDAQGQLYLSDKPVTAAVLLAEARQVAARNPDTEIQLRADEKVPYGQVAQLIGQLQDVGLSHIGFITQGAPKN
jgi:biopolymer transport protein TolR